MCNKYYTESNTSYCSLVEHRIANSNKKSVPGFKESYYGSINTLYLKEKIKGFPPMVLDEINSNLVWLEIEKLKKLKKEVKGLVLNGVPAGYSVLIGNLVCFTFKSSKVREVGKWYNFIIHKINKKNNNVVLKSV